MIFTMGEFLPVINRKGTNVTLTMYVFEYLRIRSENRAGYKKEVSFPDHEETLEILELAFGSHIVLKVFFRQSQQEIDAFLLNCHSFYIEKKSLDPDVSLHQIMNEVKFPNKKTKKKPKKSLLIFKNKNRYHLTDQEPSYE